MLNDREAASLIWLCVGLVWALFQKDIRKSFGAVLASLVHPNILLAMAALAGYVTTMVLAGERVGLWSFPLLKDTVIWFIGSGLVLLFSVTRTSSNERFFARTALAEVEFGAFLNFYMNLAVFPLATELVLQPLITFLVLFSNDAGVSPKNKAAKAIIDAVLALTGTVMMVIVAVQLFGDWNSFDKTEAVLSLVLPIWLTVSVFPFIYLFSLIVNYEVAFTGIRLATDDNRTRRRAKFALITGFHIRSRDLRAFAGVWFRKLVEAKTFSEARRVIAEQRASVRETEAAKKRRADRLRRYAEVKGTDERGLQLDQREFIETRRALDWLATCQMGWYRNGGRYRADILDILGGFTTQGLPVQHGISVTVRDDGQSWFGWRRTVTGWCFAIGASGPPPDRWEYDGPEPPAGFPGESPSWLGDQMVPNPNWSFLDL